MRPSPKPLYPLAAAFFAMGAAAQGNGRPGHGLIGYGTEMYNPPCAYTCGSMAVRFKLDCRGVDDPGSFFPSPDCLAANDPYLQTAAWCIHTHCRHGEASASKLDWFWETELIGHEVGQPSPKYSYQEALAHARAAAPPTAIAPHDEYLNATSLVDEGTYLAAYNGNRFYEVGETVTSGYAIFLFVICVAIPIALSWMPLPRGLQSRVYGWLIDPPALGSRHATPVLLGLAIAPTRGQALFLCYVWIVNVVLCSAGYVIVQPHGWYSSVREQVLTYVANRTGHLSLANLALAVLLSSRNSPLLWLTGWAPATLLLLHRWVAVIGVLQAVAHSVLYLVVFLERGQGVYAFALTQSYWLWGVAATVLLAAMVPLSVLPLRRRFYEAFLASHVVLAALALVACLCHIYYRYQWQWGYEIWVWIAFAFWGSDRLVARPWRILRSGGVKRALVTVVDDDYLRLDIPGWRLASGGGGHGHGHGHGHAYLYFPTLTWRVWENHPFSVAAVSGTEPEHKTPPPRTVQVGPATATATIYIRRHRGLTAALARQTHGAQGGSSGLAVLVEASYGTTQTSLCPAPCTTAATTTPDYPNLICVAGGVGIAAILPLVRTPPRWPGGCRRLFWGVRTPPLVRSVQHLLGEEDVLLLAAATGGQGVHKARWADVDVAVSVGARFDIPRVLGDALRENQASGVGGTVVMVCGPPGMADEVRMVVAAAAREGLAVRLREESFSW